MDKITILSSFSVDEMGNGFLNELSLYEIGYHLGEVISEEECYGTFGSWKHSFTVINMADFYRELIESEDCEVGFIFLNNLQAILNYNTDVLTCDIHTRESIKILKVPGVNVYVLHIVLTESIRNFGFNIKYGLFGSNKTTEEKLKIFPKTGYAIVKEVQKKTSRYYGK